MWLLASDRNSDSFILLLPLRLQNPHSHRNHTRPDRCRLSGSAATTHVRSDTGRSCRSCLRGLRLGGVGVEMIVDALEDVGALVVFGPGAAVLLGHMVGHDVFLELL